MMKRYLLIMVAMMAFFLILFFIVEALGVPLLTDPTPWMRHGGILAAVLGVGLLIADVLLPVPSRPALAAPAAPLGAPPRPSFPLPPRTAAPPFRPPLPPPRPT